MSFAIYRGDGIKSYFAGASVDRGGPIRWTTCARRGHRLLADVSYLPTDDGTPGTSVDMIRLKIVAPPEVH